MKPWVQPGRQKEVLDQQRTPWAFGPLLQVSYLNFQGLLISDHVYAASI